MNKRNRVLVSLAGAVVVGAGVLCNNVFADNSTESEFSVTITPSATIVIPSSPVNLIVEPTAAGVFGSGSFNVTAYTNNPGGYTVTMTTDNTSLTSDTVNITTGDFYTIPTLSANTTQANFELNKWGISLDGGTNYIPMTASNTLMDEDTATGAQGDTQAIGYATKLDLETVPGTYSTTIGFAITAKIVGPQDYTNGGGGDEGSCHEGGVVGDSTGSGTCDTGSGNGAYFPANSLLRAFEVAYVYNHKPIYVADDATNTSWHLMQEGETVGGGKQVRFAMQDIDLKFEENGITYSVCDYAAQSNRSASPAYTDEALVMDLRDGKSYWIAKLEDGKCWMTSNLDHNIVSTTDYYNDINTDLGWNGSAYPSELAWNSTTQTYSNTPSVSRTGVATQVVPTTAQWRNNVPVSVDVGEWYQLFNASNDTACAYLSESCPTLFTNTRSDWTMIHRNQGNFYNWNAATFNLSESHQTATTSICPRGWTLPSTAGEYYGGLYNIYGGEIRGAPIYLGYAGYYNATSASGGSSGDYYEDDQDSDKGYCTHVSSNWIETEMMCDEKGYMVSVRCVAR